MKKDRPLTAIISKIVLIAVIIFISFQVVYLLTSYNRCNHDFDLQNKDRYLWLFKKTDADTINCYYPLANIKFEKFRYLYACNDEFTYLIIEESQLRNVSLNKINVAAGRKVNKSLITPWERNDLHWIGHIDFQSKFCIDTSSELKVNVDNSAFVETGISSNKRIFSGNIKEMSIENEEGTVQYLLKYDKPEKTGVIFYRLNNKLYIIIANSFSDSTDLNRAISKLLL